jgi:predicted DNA binding protein
MIENSFFCFSCSSKDGICSSCQEKSKIIIDVLSYFNKNKKDAAISPDSITFLTDSEDLSPAMSDNKAANLNSGRFVIIIFLTI